MKVIIKFLVDSWNKYGGSIIFSAIAIVAGFVSIKISKVLISKAFKKIKNSNPVVENWAKKATKIGIVGIVSFLVLNKFNVSVGALAAIASSLLFSLGIGLKDVASNFFKGVQMKLTNPYKVGDLIEVGEVKGRVEKLDLLYTYLVNSEGGSIMLPNSSIIGNHIVNFSKHNKSLKESGKQQPQNPKKS